MNDKIYGYIMEKFEKFPSTTSVIMHNLINIYTADLGTAEKNLYKLLWGMKNFKEQ
jgi:hypothetical protein